MSESNSYFPPELLLDILLNLPVESLIRFTIVSKSWHSLITSPSFITTHLNQIPRTNTLLIRHYENTNKKEHYELFKDEPFFLNLSSKLNLSINSPIGYFRIVGICNGIICLCDGLFGDLKSLILWNPCIQKVVTLPLPLIKPKSPHMYVLGFGVNNDSFDDYKLVRLVYRKAGDGALSRYRVPPKVEVYSTSTGFWRIVVGVEIKHCVVEYMWSQAFLNGAVHWIAYDVGDDASVRSLVMRFTVADELFGEIMLPDALASISAANLSIMVFEGCLVVVKYEREIDGGLCEVWVMKSYGVLESWTRLYLINLAADMVKVVGFRHNGEVLFSTSSYELVSYDPSTGDKKDLGIHGSPRSFYVQKYMESLALLQWNNVVTDDILDGMGSLWM